MTDLRAEIIAELNVPAEFNAYAEVEHRLAFLTDLLVSSGAEGYVLGISGGVDSATAGRLCQLAVERARDKGAHATFIAMRLPYGVQADEHDAVRALDFIRPDETLTVDIKPASDALLGAVENGLGENEDFLLGNIKARQRMIAQYAVAGARHALVVGTDHAAEAVMGFFTKYGDGAADLTPLAGLTKRRVRAVCAALGAPHEITVKVPTADLETNRPGLPDEHAFGVTYDEIDDFLEGLEVTKEAYDTITDWHRRTAHKRTLPVSPR